MAPPPSSRSAGSRTASSCTPQTGTCRRSWPNPTAPNFASGDWFPGTAEDYTNEASSYLAYTGPFHVDEDNQTLTHTMFISLFPDWTRQTQPRAVKIDGDTLHLGSVSPIQSSGRTVMSQLTWRRAEPQ